MSTVVGCSGKIGRLVKIKSDDVAPLSITFDGSSVSSMGLCTGLDLSHGVAAQFQNTLGDSIYVTPFGDAIGDCQISFMLNKSCVDPTGSINAVGNNGDVVETYFKKRLLPTGNHQVYSYETNTYSWQYNKTPQIRVAVGSSVFYGFITGLQISGTTTSGVVIIGKLLMKVWPFATNAPLPGTT